MDTHATHDLESLMEHAEWLRRLALHLVRDPSAADDVVQETWLAAMRRPPDAGRPARPWLAGVARKIASMRARSEGRLAARQRAAARRDELPPTAELVEKLDSHKRLSEAVLALDEPYRTTVLLRYFHGLPSAEIARRQNKPQGTVRWRLKRGIDALRVELDESFGDRQKWGAAFALAFGGGAEDSSAVTGAGVSSAALLWVTGLTAAVVTGAVFLRSDADVVRAFEPDLAALSRTEVDATADLPLLGDRFRAPVREASARPVIEPSALATTRAIFRVLDETGAPARGVPLVLVESGGTGHHATTDGQGEASFAYAIGSGELFVKRHRGYLHRETYASLAGTHYVELPLGRALTGRLTVQGRAPESPIPLTLATDRTVNGGDVPDAVRERFGSARRANASTDEEGRFEFHGLAPTWSGTLLFPIDWKIIGKTPDHPESGGHHVDEPREGVELDLAPRPRLKGRALRARDGSPLANAGLQVTLGEHKGGRVRTDDAGNFDRPWDKEDATSLTLTFGKEGLRAVVPTQGGFDLGDVRLEPDATALSEADEAGVATARGVPFEGMVSDELGEPLVAVEMEQERESGSPTRMFRTDDRGLFRMRLAGSAPWRVRAEKRGFATTWFEFEALPRTPVALQLTPGFDVVVRVPDANASSVTAHPLRRPWGRVSAVRRADDAWVVHDLPAGPCRFVLVVDGRTLEESHDPAHGELAFELSD